MAGKGEGFVVIDGLDGVGKGTIERALTEYETDRKRLIFDSVDYSKKNHEIPEFNSPQLSLRDFYNTIITSEPTYAGIGRVIRDEIIAKNGRDYSFSDKIQAYSLDRLVQMKRLVIPALQEGKRVIQSRCLASTLCYQALEADKLELDVEFIHGKILEQEGNILQLKYSPDLLIIPTIKDVDELTKRIEARKKEGKDDNCVFENAEFQRALKPHFESPWLKDLFESNGTKVVYLNAGISVEETKRQAVNIYSDFLHSLKHNA